MLLLCNRWSEWQFQRGWWKPSEPHSHTASKETSISTQSSYPSRQATRIWCFFSREWGAWDLREQGAILSGQKNTCKRSNHQRRWFNGKFHISYMLVSNEKRPLRGQRDTQSMKSKVVVYYGQDLGSRVWKKMFNILRQCMWLHVAFKNH